LWLLTHSNEELYFEIPKNDWFCIENEVTSVTFIELLDEVIERFFTTWWEVISQPCNPRTTPWHLNLANSSKKSTMSPHHSEWSRKKNNEPLTLDEFIDKSFDEIVYKGLQP